jgi:hypothetical protein
MVPVSAAQLRLVPRLLERAAPARARAGSGASCGIAAICSCSHLDVGAHAHLPAFVGTLALLAAPP